jgi:hypothetical protein
VRLAFVLVFVGGGSILPSSPAQEEAQGRGRVFVEVATSESEYFQHQPFEITMRIGVARAFLRDNLIQPFRQHLDLPLRLDAPWIDGPEGAILVRERGGGERGRPSFVLNGELARAIAEEDSVRDGERYAVLRITRRYLPTRSGEFVLPAPTLRYSYATRFREDFLEGRVPEDRLEGNRQGRRLALRIRPLPVADRPPEFLDAVGAFTVRAQAEPVELHAGNSLQLRLHIEGQGNLDHLRLPKLEALEGFHVLGRLEVENPEGRTVTFDLVPLSSRVTEVPSIRFAYFDPTPPGRYRRLFTEAIPLRVSPPPGGDPAMPPPAAGLRRPIAGVLHHVHRHCAVPSTRHSAGSAADGAASLPRYTLPSSGT